MASTANITLISAQLNVNLIKLLLPASFVKYFVVPLSKKIIEVFAKWSYKVGTLGHISQAVSGQ